MWNEIPLNNLLPRVTCETMKVAIRVTGLRCMRVSYCTGYLEDPSTVVVVDESQS